MYKDFRDLLENMDKLSKAKPDYVEEAGLTDRFGNPVTSGSGQQVSTGTSSAQPGFQATADETRSSSYTGGDVRTANARDAVTAPPTQGYASSTTTSAPADTSASSSYSGQAQKTPEPSAQASSSGYAPAAMNQGGYAASATQTAAAPTGIFSNPTMTAQQQAAPASSAPAKTYGGGYDPSKVQYAASGGKVAEPKAGQAVTKPAATTKTGTGASGFPTQSAQQMKQRAQNAAGSAMGAGYAQAAGAKPGQSVTPSQTPGLVPGSIADRIRNYFKNPNREPLVKLSESESQVLDAMIEYLQEAELSEKYMGFKAVEKAAKKGGAKDPAAVAASIGRKKYGKKKFQAAAAKGKKLGEDAQSDIKARDKASRDANFKADLEHVASGSAYRDKSGTDYDRFGNPMVDGGKTRRADAANRTYPVYRTPGVGSGSPDKPPVQEAELEESGLQAYLGNKKYGKEGMNALRQAGRDGASKEKMAKLRAKYDKLDETDPATLKARDKASRDANFKADLEHIASGSAYRDSSGTDYDRFGNPMVDGGKTRRADAANRTYPVYRTPGIGSGSPDKPPVQEAGLEEGYFGDNVGKIGIFDIPEFGVFSYKRSKFEKELENNPELAPYKDEILDELQSAYNRFRNFNKAKQAALELGDYHRRYHPKKAQKSQMVGEQDMEEGAGVMHFKAQQAKAKGEDSFKLGDKEFPVKENEHDYADDRNADDDARYNLPHTWPKGKKPAKWNTHTGRVSHWDSRTDDEEKKDWKSMIESKKAKPDYLDFDKDGDKKEPMKKALADKKKSPVSENIKVASDKQQYKNRGDMHKVKSMSIPESSFTPNDADNPKQKPSLANKRYGDLKVANLHEDAKFQELDALYKTFLSEEITISSTHNAGTQSKSSMMSGMPEPEDSVNVTARGEDAKELLSILRNAGMIDGDDSAKDKESSEEHDITTDIDVVDAGDSDADFEIEKTADHDHVGDGYGTLQVIQPEASADMFATDEHKPHDMMSDLLAKLTGIGAPDMSGDEEESSEEHEEDDEDAASHDDAEDSDDSAEDEESDDSEDSSEEDEADSEEDSEDDEETSESTCNECGMYESECGGTHGDKEQIDETDDGTVARGYEQEEELVAEGVGMIGTTPEGLQNGNDDEAVQDIKFLTQTIAGGLNKPKVNQHVHPYNNPGPGLSESADHMKPVNMRDILDRLTKIQ